MHTAMVISGGLLLLAAMILGARLFGIATTASAARAFIPLWFIAAAINLSVGVLRAGYTVMQELPIMLVVFGLPAAIALFIAWRTAN